MLLWCQPRYRPATDIVAAANLGKRLLATVAAFDRLVFLVRGKLRLPPHLDTVRLGAGAAFAGAGADQVALEFRKPTKNGV